MGIRSWRPEGCPRERSLGAWPAEEERSAACGRQLWTENQIASVVGGTAGCHLGVEGILVRSPSFCGIRQSEGREFESPRQIARRPSATSVPDGPSARSSASAGFRRKAIHLPFYSSVYTERMSFLFQTCAEGALHGDCSRQLRQA